MAEAHVDTPGEIHWFSGEGPAPVLGPCPHHGCPHNALATLAWGPDHAHYELNRCDADCAGECRAWSMEYPPPFSEDRPKFRLAAFLHAPLAVSGEQR